MENLTLSQWSVANLAILYKLVGEGKLVGNALMDTSKFYQLVQRCSMVSVLLYDKEYRQLQASMGFRWGTDLQHLHTLHLQPRDRLSNQGTNPKKVTKHPTPPKSPKEENQAYAEASIQLRDVLTLSATTNTFVSYQDVVRAILSLLMCR